MTDSPYRSTPPKVLRGEQYCILIDQIVAVTHDSNHLKDLVSATLRSGETITVTLNDKNRAAQARRLFQEICDAIIGGNP